MRHTTGTRWNGVRSDEKAAAVPNPTVPNNFGVSFVAHYGGTFNVTTSDGVNSSHTVNNDADLRTYNNFLIAQLQAGNLDPAQYNTLFSRGYTSTTEQITYGQSADSPPDEVAQPIGNRIVMHLVGANAHGTIAPGATLEVVNASPRSVGANSSAKLGRSRFIGEPATAGEVVGEHPFADESAPTKAGFR